MHHTASRRLGCLALLFFSASMAQTQHAPAFLLKDGQNIHVTGILAARYTGWDARLVLVTKAPYLADFGEDGRKTVHEIELGNYLPFLDLSKHTGERATASGRLQLNSTSPYYWNGVLLVADTVRLQSGRVFQPTPRPEGKPLPANVRTYLYRETLIPKSFRQHASVMDLDTHLALPSDQAGGCMVSGGGSGGVMNCGCANGFIAERGAVARTAVPVEKLGTPKDRDAPQFVVPETPVYPITVELLCVRKNTGLNQ